jgi:hypothetical protein
MAGKTALIVYMVLLPMVVACREETDLCDSGNQVSVVRQELRDSLLEDLAMAGIPTQETGPKTICYPSSKAAYVTERLIAIDLQQRPRNRITITDGPFKAIAFEHLQQRGFDFEVMEKDEEIILIFEDEETAMRAFEVIGEVSKDLYDPNARD